MSAQPVVIIGAGVAGLAAGCYLQANGYRTRILEMGACCGGVCVSWKRAGYVFDGATNWLPGSSPSSNLHELLAELIDFSALQFVYSDVFLRIEHAGACVDIHKNAGRLRDEMLRISPGDARAIQEFTDAIMEASRLKVPYRTALDVMTAGDKLRFLAGNARLLLFRARWRPITIAAFAARFKNETLRHAVANIFPHHDFFSLFGLLMSLGWMHAGSDGTPLGGSKRFVDMLEQRYRNTGGEIVFGAKVDRIEFEDKRACAAICADGSRITADRVISAADGHDTLFRLLKGRALDQNITRRFETWRVFPAIIQVSLGVNRRFGEPVHKYLLDLAKPLTFGNSTVRDMIVRICSFDPSFAPPGKTAVVAHLRLDDHEYWTELRSRDPTAYRACKEQAAQAVIATLDKRFGDVAGKIDVCDVATPATYMRYTNIWKGGYQGFAPTPQAAGALLRKTVPGLDRFYMTGQWLWPGGGMPAVMRVSRDVAQMICHEDGKPFSIR
jgi:phytoene dehydrogenase-like protein